MNCYALCYHRVLPEVVQDLGTIDTYHHARSILHSLADFRNQLDVLQERCEIVDAAGFVRARAGEVSVKPAVLLTFDDGYADFASVIMPELLARGLPCVLFPTKAPVTTSFVPPRDQVYAILAADYRSRRRISEEERQSWISGSNKARMLEVGPSEQAALIDGLAACAGVDFPLIGPAHMTETQIRQLPSSVYLGAHGLFHHEFGSLSDGALRGELREILGWIAHIRPTQDKGVWLAYPNGKSDREVRPGAVTKAVAEAKVDYAFKACFRHEPSKSSRLEIPRMFSKDGVDYLRPIWDKNL
jgi:peptidoglycan/xylan/chitin deacetylase (PgdA/CDA1 family)